jgi:COMPASS component SPP1
MEPVSIITLVGVGLLIIERVLNDSKEVKQQILLKHLKNKLQNWSQQPEDKKIYCLCRQPEKEERLMIQCDGFEEWFHSDCVRLNKKEIQLYQSSDSKYYCPFCKKIDQ